MWPTAAAENCQNVQFGLLEKKCAFLDQAMLQCIPKKITNGSKVEPNS
jgi:hypothetical protein